MPKRKNKAVKRKKDNKTDKDKIKKNRIDVFNKRFPAGSKRTSSSLKDFRFSTGK